MILEISRYCFVEGSTLVGLCVYVCNKNMFLFGVFWMFLIIFLKLSLCVDFL